MNKRSLFVVFLVIVCSFTCLGNVPSKSDPDGYSFKWTSGRRQVNSWLRSDLSVRRITSPVVSVKVALRDGIVPTDISIVKESWISATSSARRWKDHKTAALGSRGMFHNVPYQEVLIFPLRDSGTEGKVLVLNRLVFRLIFDNKISDESKYIPTGKLSPWSNAFLNPSDAIEVESLSAPVRTSRKSVLPDTAMRIEISSDGIYRLDYNFLNTHGMTPGAINPANLHLYCLGNEIPIYIEGPAVSTFDTSNAIIFYGQKANITNKLGFNGGDCTDTAVYWLFADNTAGLRMTENASAPVSGYAQPSDYEHTEHFETNSYFMCTQHIRPNGDAWYWAPVLYQGSPGTYTLNVPHVSTGSNASITAVMRCFAATSHSFSATLNGNTPSSGPDPATWSGLSLATFDWDLTGLVSGNNTLSLTVTNSGDYLMPDYFDVTYSRTFDADSDHLTFEGIDENTQYACNGFSSEPYVLDISDADSTSGLVSPDLLTGGTFSSGTSTFEMPYNAAVSSRKVALSASTLVPDKAEMTTIRNLSDPALRANLLIITHPDFHPSGSDDVWQEYFSRRSTDMYVQVVDIQEIYDNYSYGFMDPTAIRTFLGEVEANWTTVPKYVLLIGDGSYDYKNYMNDATFKNWVPTMMFEDTTDSMYMGYYPSDAWFADVDEDGYPDMAVGRLPVRSYSELAGLLTKIMAYEDQTLTGNWYKGGLFVADTYTETWEQEFETYNDYMQTTYFQSPWIDQHVYFHDSPYNGTDTDTCATDIRSAWSDSVFVHYSGHSGIEYWGKTYPIFTSYPSRNCGSGTCQDSDVDLLPPITTGASPYAPLPFVINSSCYNAGFEQVGDPSLMEALTSSTDKGCIASSGFSTIAYQYEEEVFNNALLDQMTGRYKIRTVGDLVEAGRFASPSNVPRLVMGNILLGDPVTSLRIPAPSAPLSLTATPLDSAIDIDWLASNDTVSYYNIYKSTDSQTTWSFLAQVPSTNLTYTDSSLINGNTYDYYLTSVDADGFEGPASNAVSATPVVSPCSLTCSATAPAAVTVGLPAQCTSSITPVNCSGSPSIDWDFGDGSAHSSEQNPSHSFVKPGISYWSMTAIQDGQTCSDNGSTVAVNPPGILSVSKLSRPFRIKILGANLQEGIAVYLNGTLWDNVVWKSSSKIMLKDGSDLKAFFPEDADTEIRLLNPDSGEITLFYSKSENTWRYDGTETLYPPAVSLVKKKKIPGHPLKVVVKGVNFGVGSIVYVDSSIWTDTTIDGNTKITLNGGSALKDVFPSGVMVPIRILNPDGCETTVKFDRGSNSWEPVE